MDCLYQRYQDNFSEKLPGGARQSIVGMAAILTVIYCAGCEAPDKLAFFIFQ